MEILCFWKGIEYIEFMPIHYMNHNGTLVPEDTTILKVGNRGFRYGDGIFETMLYKDGQIRFLPFHIERLQRSMDKIHLEKVNKFDAYFVKTVTEELIRKNNMIGQRGRVRLIVYRDGEGLYTPQTNDPEFIVQVHKIEEPQHNKKVGLIVDLYTEYKKPY